MTIELEYLHTYLADEFKDLHEVRIRIRHKAGIKRSPDLFQDYDPESNTLHAMTGVEVRLKSREYFFPADWAASSRRPEVNALIREIWDFVGEKTK